MVGPTLGFNWPRKLLLELEGWAARQATGRSEKNKTRSEKKKTRSENRKIPKREQQNLISTPPPTTMAASDDDSHGAVDGGNCMHDPLFDHPASRMLIVFEGSETRDEDRSDMMMAHGRP
eukprot:scaffold16596_cov107-Isochrysis_galbana.AAC.5